jgi:hypothetical protein
MSTLIHADDELSRKKATGKEDDLDSEVPKPQK